MLAMRDRAADERGMQESGQHDIVDVAAASGQQPRILRSLDRLADEPVARDRRYRGTVLTITRLRRLADRAGRRGRCPDIRCSGTNCRIVLRESPRPSGPDFPSGARSPRPRSPVCRSRTANRALRETPAARRTGRPPAASDLRSSRHRHPAPAPRRSDRLARTAPSSSTVQAPQTPCSQPTCVPVSPRSSRRTSASVLRGSTTARRCSPLTVSRTGTGSVTSVPPGQLAAALARPSPHPPAAIDAIAVDVVGRLAVRDGKSAPTRPHQRFRTSAPTAADSAAAARSGVDPSPISPIANRLTRPASSTCSATAAPAIAKSPCRRANSATP